MADVCSIFRLVAKCLSYRAAASCGADLYSSIALRKNYMVGAPWYMPNNGFLVSEALDNIFPSNVNTMCDKPFQYPLEEK